MKDGRYFTVVQLMFHSAFLIVVINYDTVWDKIHLFSNKADQ